jgi:signal transduction histidine kinase
MGLRLSSWRTALIGIVVIKAVLSLAVTPGSFLVSYSGISYFLLLVLATAFAIRNGIQNTLGSRTFWSFLAIGFGLWSLNQYLQLHYELGLQLEVPQDSIADTLLFLHVVMLMAVVTALPRRAGTKPKLSRVALDSFFLLLFWTSLYAYAVFPYQYLHSTSSHGVRFEILYLAANLTLVLAAGILTLRTEGPWKQVCLHLFGASVLYTIGSAVANLALDTGGYVNGKLYGLCLTASVCWFVWIPLQARQEARAETTTIISDNRRAIRPLLWPIAMVVMISIPIVWELLRRNENAGLRTLRLSVAVSIIVCLASAAYIKEYLDRHESLRESEQRFRMAAQAGKMYSFDWDVMKDQVARSPEHVKVLGSTAPLQPSHQQFVQRIHSGDRPKFTAAVAGLTPEKSTAEVIYRVQSSDGGLVWLRSSGRGFFDSDGKLVRVIGMVADITDLKRAEEALSRMTRKLVEAQEQERARIARELHDDIGQRLALLSVNLTQLQERCFDSPNEVVNRLQEVQQQTAEISADVHSLSHELHSSGLEYLGPVGGIKSWCKEFGERQGMQIDFISSEVPGSLPSDIGLCLFRVLQEALHNAAKHSGVKRTEVQLRGESGEIHLIVKDLGKGFDLAAGAKGRGLGLTSMQERVRLVNGVISFESKPMTGTTIHVRVPQVLDEQQRYKQGA